MPDKWAKYAVSTTTSAAQPDPWAQYVQPSVPSGATDPSGRTPTGEPAQGDTRNFFQRALDNLTTRDPRREEWQGPVKTGADAYARGAAEMAVPLVSHPLKTLGGMAKTLATTDLSPQGLGQAFVGPMFANFMQEKQDSGLGYALPHALGQGTGMWATGEALKPVVNTGLQVAGKVGTMLKRAVTGDINAPIPGTDVTPSQRYAAMRETGVQPDAAQATNSPLLRLAKAVNENSLTSSGLYENARARNLGALGDYTTGALNEMSPLSPEEGGAAVQKGLLEHHADLKAKGQEGFTQLEQQTEGQQIPGAKDVAQQARQIVDKNAAYYKEHPEFAPHKALAVVQNLARKAPPGAPEVTPGFGSAASVPPASAARVETSPSLWSASGSTGGLEAQPRLPGYSELHQLRSDLLEFNNANPDLVKNRANSWISNLAGVVDQAITSGEGSLTPDQVKIFRDANTRWNTMKSTYDNPQNPLYHAARTLTPSTLVKGISRTPEMAQTLKGAIGGEGMGPIQRGVAEDVLGRTATGDYNFKTFQGKFNRQLSPEYRGSLYTPEQQRQLGNIGQTGSVINWEPNPSGTAKLGQKIAEAGAIPGALINPLALGSEALYHGGQYALGRAMNSPAMVEWLMRQPRPANANPLIPPILLPANTRR